MHRSGGFLACSVLVALALAGSAAAAGKASRISGVASENAHTVSFPSGVSWWNRGERRLTVVFLPAAVSQAEREEIVRRRSVFRGMNTNAEYLELNLILKAGASAVETATLERYNILFANFPGTGAMTFNRQHYDWAEDGGIYVLTGTPDTVVRGHFKREDQFHQRTYKWDLTFDVSRAR